MTSVYSLLGHPGVTAGLVRPFRPDITLDTVFAAANGNLGLQDPFQKKRLRGWDELSKPFPKQAGLVLASMSTPKKVEGRSVLADFDFSFRTAHEFFGSTVPDSDEEQENAFLIAEAKTTESVMNEWAMLRKSEKAASLRALGVECERDVMVAGEDRAVAMDLQIASDPVFDFLRNSTDPLVAEAFSEGHDFPGKRMKEVMKACGGPVEFLQMVTRAKENLRGQGKEVSDDVTVGVSIVIKPLVENTNLPLPPEGIVAYAQEEGARFRELTDEDIARAKAGVDFDMDHFQIPAHRVLQGESITTSQERDDPDSDYIARRSPLAQAMNLAFKVMNAPQLEHPKTYHLKDRPKAPVADASQLGEFADAHRQKPVKGYVQPDLPSRINHLGDVERVAWVAEGYVIDDQPDPNDFADPLDRLTVKVERALIHDSVAALKPHGGFIATGRPLFVHERALRKEFSYMGNFHNSGAVAHQTHDVITPFVDRDELRDVMRRGRWDMEMFKENPDSPPDFNMITADALFARMGVADPDAELGYRVAKLATASAKIVKGLQDTHHACLLDAQAGITSFSGGGTREGMKAILDGNVQAFYEGYRDFVTVGVRTGVVSRVEGSAAQYFQSLGMAPSHGGFDDDYYRLMDDTIHMFEMEYMAERQHAIYVGTHASDYFMFGIGGSYEFHTDALSNAYIERGREGLFFNYEKRPMFVMNSQIPQNGHTAGYFDKYLSRFTPEDMEIMQVQVFDTPRAMLEAKMAHAKTLGFDLKDPDKSVVYMRKWKQQPASSSSGPA